MVITNNKALVKKIQSVQTKIGNTPLLKIKGLHNNPNVNIYAKAEWGQLSGSVKARAAFNIIYQAVKNGELDEHRILLDATSGNTGIAYATICNALGIKATIVLPENASKKRKEWLYTMGAEIIYSSGFGGTDEAQEVALEIALTHPDTYFYASQYTNDNNWKAHYYGTAEEIIKELPSVNYFVAGIGTGGTFTGTTRRLKEYNPQIEAIALQPDIALHGLEGWKHLETAIVPKIYDPTVANSIIEITTEESYHVIKRMYRTSGLKLSPSAAANIAGALHIAEKISSGNIVTILPDNAYKYNEIINNIIEP